MDNEFYSNCPGSQEYSHSCVMKHIVRKLYLSVCSLLIEWTEMGRICFLIFQQSKQNLNQIRMEKSFILSLSLCLCLSLSLSREICRVEG